MTSQRWQDCLEPSSYLRTLFDSLPVGSFVDLSALESFASRHTTLLMLSRPTTPAVGLGFRQVGELPFGELQLIDCAGLAVGYLLVAPRCRVKRVSRNFAALVRRETDDEVRRLYVDGRLIVLGNDSAMLATVPSREWIG